ncbi:MULTISPECIES: hypothetical protein [Streptomyces]|uniref:Sigma-like protein n=1 Tax=Streptomyces chengmaiensis TaxID=3040919 RepID=A0ABT6HZS5_9ACTN|nr:MULTISPECIES: hypothetical protein [Streptomyces]MDH2393319.1 hypothetical protein [Streptomyces chengmaiensis]WRQ82732.1 hypothetical protein I3F59_027155 [Streptomyces sp. MUM 178J]
MSEVGQNENLNLTTMDSHAPAPPKGGFQPADGAKTMDSHAPAPPPDGLLDAELEGIVAMDSHAPAPPADGGGAADPEPDDSHAPVPPAKD